MKNLLLSLLFLSVNVWANNTNEVIVTVGYGPGGTNTIIRTFASDASNAGNTKYIVEERPGANGSIALKTYFSNSPTNKSILGTSGGQVLFEALVRPENNYIPRIKIIGPVLTSPLSIAVKSDSKFKSASELFDKKIPKQRINIAVGGESHEMLVNQIAKYSHHDIQSIRYKGGNDQFTAVMGGHVDMIIDAFGSLNQRGTQVRILGVTQPNGAGTIPSLSKYAPVPTMLNYFGMTINRDTPDIQELVRDITIGFIRADRVDFYKAQGYNIDLNPNNDYAEREVLPAYNKWRKLLNK